MSEWVDRRTAARLIGATVPYFSVAWARGELPAVLKHKPAKLVGIHHAAGPSRLGYLRADCVRLDTIRRRCRISLADACRVMASLEKDGPL